MTSCLVRAEVGDVSKEPPPPRVTQSQLRRQRRLERYQQVVALFNSGQTQAAISRTLGIGRKTIRRWLRRGEFPERKPPQPSSAQSKRVCRLPATTLERGLPQCIAPLSRDSPERLFRKARHGEAFCCRMEQDGESHIAGAPQRISPKHAAILVT